MIITVPHYASMLALGSWMMCCPPLTLSCAHRHHHWRGVVNSAVSLTTLHHHHIAIVLIHLLSRSMVVHGTMLVLLWCCWWHWAIDDTALSSSLFSGLWLTCVHNDNVVIIVIVALMVLDHWCHHLQAHGCAHNIINIVVLLIALGHWWRCIIIIAIIVSRASVDCCVDPAVSKPAVVCMTTPTSWCCWWHWTIGTLCHCHLAVIFRHTVVYIGMHDSINIVVLSIVPGHWQCCTIVVVIALLSSLDIWLYTLAHTTMTMLWCWWWCQAIGDAASLSLSPCCHL